MPEIGTSGLMSGVGKRGGARRQYPRPTSTLPANRFFLTLAAVQTACYSVAMPSGYIPIFIFLAIAICFPVVAIMAAKLIRSSAPFAVKLEA